MEKALKKAEKGPSREGRLAQELGTAQELRGDDLMDAKNGSVRGDP
jgi:hypothetical protein